MACSKSKPISRADVFFSAVSLPRMLRKRSAPRACRYHLLCANSNDSLQAENVVPRDFWRFGVLALRKSFNVNDLIFQTVEDGFEALSGWHLEIASCQA